MDSIIEIKNLSFSRQDRKIFDGVDINIARGKVTAIMGPSGTGKTTLLRLIGGQLVPDSGTVLVKGKDIHAMSRKELYNARRDMGMLFQSGALFTHLSVFENVAFPLREHTKLSNEVIRDLVLMKLQAVGLRGARDLMPSELSGGMSRRVALARAVIFDPQIIMYDEPFSGQDPIATGSLVKMVRMLNDTLGLTTIIVSHNVEQVKKIADQVYMLAGGKVIGEGSMETLQQSSSEQVQQFVKGLPDGPVTFHTPACDYEEDLFGGERV